MFIDLGDPISLVVSTYATTGTVAVTCTVYQPDGTTITPSVTNNGGGVYGTTLTPTQMGRHSVKWSATNASVTAYEKDFEVRDFFQLQPFTVAEAKKFLNIKKNDNDEELVDFIDTAVDLSEEYCGRVFGRRTITEIHEGGTTTLFYRKPCALSVTSVVENAITLDPTTYKNDPYGHSVIRIDNQKFSTMPFSTVVTFVAGYNTTPKGAVQGIKLLLNHLWETQRGSVSINSNRNADSYDPRATYTWPNRVKEALFPYILPRLG